MDWWPINYLKDFLDVRLFPLSLIDYLSGIRVHCKLILHFTGLAEATCDDFSVESIPSMIPCSYWAQD